MDEWVKDALDKFIADTGYKLQLSANCARLVKSSMVPQESVLMEVRQSYMKDLAPDRILLTNKRIIIIRPSFWGLYFGHDFFAPTSFSIVPYKNIITVVMLHGKILATINMRITGFMSSSGHDGKGQEYEGEMKGIRINNATVFVSLIEQLIERREEEDKINAHKEKTGGDSETSRATAESGAMMHVKSISLESARKLVAEKDSKFVWLGIESSEDVANLIGVGKGKVVRIDLEKIHNMNEKEAAEMTGYIFVSYGNVLPSHIVSYLDKHYGITTYVLETGMLDLMGKKLSNFG